MSKYLAVINQGSSSIKMEIFELPKLKSVWEAAASLVGQKNTAIVEVGQKQSQLNFPQGLTPPAALRQLVKLIPKEIFGTIVAVGHRVVSLGPKPPILSVVNKDLLKQLKVWSGLAPLHNQISLLLLPEALNIFPRAKHWAVADSAFFGSLPEAVSTYALPAKIRTKFKIHKIGYHGLAHQYMLKVAATKLKISESKANLITLQLGSGASACLIQNGLAADISFGFSTVSGLPMATRSGDLDPYVMLYLLDQGYTSKELKSLLFHESGWLGLSDLIDFRDILQAAGLVVPGYKSKKIFSAEQKKKAKLALEVFVYQLQKTIGGLAAVAGQVQAIVWGGAIGQHSQALRQLVWSGLRLPGRPKNLVVEVDEDLLIAKLLLANTKTL